MTSLNSNLTTEKRLAPSGNWLANLGVGWKLILIMLVLLAGFAGTFLSAYSGLQTLEYHINNLYDSMLIPVSQLDRADIALGDIETQFETIRPTTISKADKLTILGLVVAHEDTFSTIIQRYKESWTSTLQPDFTAILKEQNRLDLQQDEIATLLQIQTDFDNYVKLRAKLETAVAAGEDKENLLNSNIAAVSALRTHLRHLTDLTRQYANFSKKAALAAYNQAIFAMSTTLGVAVVLGLFLAFVVSRSIVNRLEFLTRAVQALREGRLEVSATANVGGRDEIGQVANAFDAMGQQLSQTLVELENRVTERTLDLEHRSKELADRTVQLELANIRTQKRAAQLQAISDVSRTIASVQKLAELLPRITAVVNEQFGFNHTGIFLLDQAGQYAILSAASSEGGQRMLARGHRLRVGEQGIVGYVTQFGQPRLALDTGTDATYFNNPDLPETHSEMAVPLKANGKVIGALDVQSNQVNAFSQEDLEVIQVLAEQVSIAIDNSRQFDQTQKTLSEAETIYRQYLRREWDRLGGSEKILGYRHTVTGTEQLEQLFENPQSQEALSTGSIQANSNPGNNEATLAVPIKVRDEIIGVLNIRVPRTSAWSTEEIGMVQSVVDRVAISAENARLFEESQKRAAKEQIIGGITSKIGASIDLRSIMQTAVEELGHTLSGSEVSIRLKK